MEEIPQETEEGAVQRKLRKLGRKLFVCKFNSRRLRSTVEEKITSIAGIGTTTTGPEGAIRAGPVLIGRDGQGDEQLHHARISTSM